MMKNQFLVLFSLALLIGAASFTQRPPRNLKVLPADISDAKLDSIMETYNKALGVKCGFCHVKVKGVVPDSLDYASDAEPMKENARDMMRMVIEINRNHFWYNKSVEPVYLNTITCKTCHRGEPFPPE